MANPYVYILISVILVSLVSFVGLLFLGKKKIDHLLLILVSLSAGTLFGGAFLHLLPEAVGTSGFTIMTSLLVLAGILVFFFLERIIHMHQCQLPGADIHAHHHHHLGLMSLAGDGIHNFIDGLIIAGSYLVSIPTGIATTIAVIVHELPQEIADFGVLLYSGMSRSKAIFFNFLSALAAVVGAIVGLVLAVHSEFFITILLPFAAGGFLYIAGSNLVPELHKGCDWKDSLIHFSVMIVGILLMLGLTFLE